MPKPTPTIFYLNDQFEPTDRYAATRARVLNPDGTTEWVALRPVAAEPAPPSAELAAAAEAARERLAASRSRLEPAMRERLAKADEFVTRGSGPGRRSAELRAVNAYQDELTDEYTKWAAATAATLAAEPDETRREELLAAAVAAVVAFLILLGNRRLSEAAPLALAGEPLPPDLMREVADAIQANGLYLEGLGADIERRLRETLAGDEVRAAGDKKLIQAVLAGSLLTFVGRVAAYAGAWWSLYNRGVGEAARYAGKAVYWRLEPRAKHCTTCATYGNKTWPSFEAMLEETGGAWPSHNTECGSNCRCELEVVGEAADPNDLMAAVGNGRALTFDAATQTFVLVDLEPEEAAEFAAQAWEAEAFHQGPGPHQTGTPQKIHSFRYGGGYPMARKFRERLEDELWETYKARARARAGAPVRPPKPPAPAPEPEKPKEKTWDEKAEEARLAVLANHEVAAKSAELDALRKNQEVLLTNLNNKTKELNTLNRYLPFGEKRETAEGKAMWERHEEASKERAKMFNEYQDNENKIKRLESEVSIANFPGLRAATPGALPVEYMDHRASYRTHPMTKTGKKTAELGVAMFNEMTEAGALGDAMPTVRFGSQRGGKGRSYHANDVISMAGGAPASTVVHEVGHHFEDFAPGVKRAAFDFYNARTAGEQAVPLRRYSSGYGSNEYTKPDKFIDPYVGKVYGGYGGLRATEVISMGMEWMVRDPVRLARDDPGHFKLIYIAARGGYADTNTPVVP